MAAKRYHSGMVANIPQHDAHLTSGVPTMLSYHCAKCGAKITSKCPKHRGSYPDDEDTRYAFMLSDMISIKRISGINEFTVVYRVYDNEELIKSLKVLGAQLMSSSDKVRTIALCDHVWIKDGVIDTLIQCGCEFPISIEF